MYLINFLEEKKHGKLIRYNQLFHRGELKTYLETLVGLGDGRDLVTRMDSAQFTK